MITKELWKRLEKHAGKWAAIDNGNLLATADSIEAVYKIASESAKEPVIFKIPKKKEIFILVSL